MVGSMIPTFWQWWTITGELECLLAICSVGFREEARLKIRPMLTMAGCSDFEIFAWGCLAAAVAVALWPIHVLGQALK